MTTAQEIRRQLDQAQQKYLSDLGLSSLEQLDRETKECLYRINMMLDRQLVRASNPGDTHHKVRRNFQHITDNACSVFEHLDTVMKNAPAGKQSYALAYSAEVLSGTTRLAREALRVNAAAVGC